MKSLADSGILSRSQAADTFNLNNEILAQHQHVLKRVVTHLTADRVNLKDLDFLWMLMDTEAYSTSVGEKCRKGIRPT